MLKEVEIVGLTMDSNTQTPVIILKDKDGADAVPIWIGLVEASAIAMEMEKIVTPRPLTHDLIRNILTAADIKLKKIAVTELRENTYHATLFINVGGADFEVDTRPSDAIAVALRMEAPIFIDSEILEMSRMKDPESGEEEQVAFTEENKDKWGELLERLRPEDMGKYKM